MKRQHILLPAVLILFLLPQLTFGAFPRYEIIDLGTLGGYSSRAYAINDVGQVVGESENVSGRRRAFFWENGMMTNLGTLGGDMSTALDINNSGQVVGWVTMHAFLWDSTSGMIQLDTGIYLATASAINNSGQVVGRLRFQIGAADHMFLWENHDMTDLGTILDSYHILVSGISDSEQVVGTANVILGGPLNGNAFLYENNIVTVLGTLGGDYSIANGINRSGQIVGWSNILDGSIHAFLWENGEMADIGEGIAKAINDAGQVVGYSEDIVGEDRAFLWDSKNGMVPLDELLPADCEWIGLRPQAINNRGQIVGYGINETLQDHAFLMTPIPPIPAEVRISPSTINAESKSEWITCYIRLPDGFNVADIDTNSILLEYTIEPEEFWVNESKQVAMARFRHEEVQVILEIGEVELSIVGLLRDRTVFVGTDVIRVTDKGGRGPAKNLQASVPNVTDVSITASMSWTAGSYAKSHDVYFGTSNPPPFVCNQADTTFDPGTMDYETTYYWRIDEVSKWGVTAGQLWSFTTIEAPPPPPPGGGGKPPGAPPGCFPADTTVWIDGAQVQISKVTTGQKVGKLDATDSVSCFEKTMCLKEIESVLEYQGTDDYYNIVLETGNRINVVHSHYFLTASDRWVLVENLKVGSKLKSLKGPISIKTIAKREVPFTGRFYNLKIKGGDRYYIGKDGVAVHGH